MNARVKVAVLFAAAIQGTSATAASLRAEVSAQLSMTPVANSGELAGCPSNQGIMGVCSSGRDKDCGSYHTALGCVTTSLSSAGEPEYITTSSWGDWARCPEQSIAVILCTSGEYKACQNPENNALGPTKIGCKRMDPSFLVSNNWNNGDTSEIKMKCCKYGQSCECQDGYFVTEVCTSGREADCLCENTRVFTGLKCRKLVQRSTVESWEMQGAWSYSGNIPPVDTLEVSLVSSSGQSTSEVEERSQSIMRGLEFSTSATFTYGAGEGEMSTTLSREETRTVTQSIEKSTWGSQESGQSTSSVCDPGSALQEDVEYLVAEYKRQRQVEHFPSSSLKYYRWIYYIYRNNDIQARVGTCEYMVTYPGLKPKCPPKACKDRPLCQTCCREDPTSENSPTRACTIAEITFAPIDLNEIFNTVQSNPSNDLPSVH